MASVSLKRPCQDTPGMNSSEMFKKRCNRFDPNLISATSSSSSSLSPTSSNATSPFTDPSNLLHPLSDQIATTIKQAAITASHNHQQYHQQHVSQQTQQNYSIHNQQSQQSANHNQPLFTIAQTQIICEKIIKDREQKIRQEYDKILHQQLAEQHEIFVKYTHDNITKIYNNSNISYLS